MKINQSKYKKIFLCRAKAFKERGLTYMAEAAYEDMY